MPITAHQWLRATFIMLMLCASAHSVASFVPLDPHIGKYPLGRQFLYLEDPKSQLDIHAVSRGIAHDNFTRSQTVSPNFGWSNSTYWLKFRPINTEDTAQAWFLEFAYAPLDSIEIWRVNSQGADLVNTGGDQLPYNEREIYHFKHAFKLPLAAKEQSEIYVKIQSTSLLKLGATLWSEAQFDKHQRRELTKLALICGLILTLLIYNFLIFLQLRDRNYALFCLTLAFLLLQHITHSGIASEWLWPGSILLNDYAPLAASTLSFAAIGFFFRSFLRSHELAPKIDKVFLIFAWFFALCTPLIFIDYTLAAQLVTHTLIPSLIFDFFACAYIWAQGFKAARLLLFAWALYLIAGLLYTLDLLDSLPEGLGDYDYITAGGSLSMILLAAALADRLQLIQQRHKRLKEQLLQESQRSDQLKNTFLATISHELRTPIHGVKSCLYLIGENELSQNNLEAFHMAQQSTVNLERLIERLLLFSDAVAGTLKVETEHYPLARELKTLTDEYRALYPNTSILMDEIPSNCQWLLIDGKKFTMAVQQLLDNACRFSVRRTVSINLSLIKDNDSVPGQSAEQLCVQIEDTGVGMKKTMLEKATQAFEQRDQSFSRNHGGLGVGLTLCDSLVHILNGRLKIDSVWGRGTEVSLTVPVTQCTSIATPKTPMTLLNDRVSVLVVEDNPVNQKVLATMLKKLDCDVICADHGEHAVDLYEHERLHFDLIFMDCQMPVMDGFEATKCIRRAESLNNSHTPIIAITANAMSGDRDKCLAAGMDDYLTKPVKPSQLKDAIKNNRHKKINETL